jgi:hypothetical protein
MPKIRQGEQLRLIVLAGSTPTLGSAGIAVLRVLQREQTVTLDGLHRHLGMWVPELEKICRRLVTHGLAEQLPTRPVVWALTNKGRGMAT